MAALGVAMHPTARVTISKRTVWVFMPDCIYDTQLALLGLSLCSGVQLRLRHVLPGAMSYLWRRRPLVLTGRLEMLNKVAVSTQYRGKALSLYNVSGRYQGWAYIRIVLQVFGPSPFR